MRAFCALLIIFSSLTVLAQQDSSTVTARDRATFAGKVLETVDAAGYTYALVRTDEQDVWIAGPQVSLQEGDEVSAANGMLMGTYYSKTLDREFKNLYFVTAIKTGEGNPMSGLPAGHPITDQMADNPVAIASGIEKADGGMRIAEVYRDRQSLEGETVVVKGQVVKFNAGIMGRNWIHLQDGSGDADAGNHDLTVTTDAEVETGDLVTVSGKVAVDKAFGAGYSYDVIIEEALVQPES